MTNQHPLTNKMCWEIADTEDRPFTSIERDNMREAADWQLEQVIKWIEDENTFADFIYDYNASGGYYGAQFYVSDFIADLKEAMRPQQEDNS